MLSIYLHCKLNKHIEDKNPSSLHTVARGISFGAIACETIFYMGLIVVGMKISQNSLPPSLDFLKNRFKLGSAMRIGGTIMTNIEALYFTSCYVFAKTNGYEFQLLNPVKLLKKFRNCMCLC